MVIISVEAAIGLSLLCLQLDKTAPFVLQW